MHCVSARDISVSHSLQTNGFRDSRSTGNIHLLARSYIKRKQKVDTDLRLAKAVETLQQWKQEWYAGT